MNQSVNDIIQNCKIDSTKKLILSSLNLTEQPDLNEFTWVKTLDLSNNRISVISKKKFPPFLKTLMLSDNNIAHITVNDIPETVEKIMLDRNLISRFDGKEFKNIKKMSLARNYIDNNPFEFPSNIIELDISSNTINTLDDFPKSLKDFDCSDNNISYIECNDALEMINFSSNKIIYLINNVIQVSFIFNFSKK